MASIAGQRGGRQRHGPRTRSRAKFKGTLSRGASRTTRGRGAGTRTAGSVGGGGMPFGSPFRPFNIHPLSIFRPFKFGLTKAASTRIFSLDSKRSWMLSEREWDAILTPAETKVMMRVGAFLMGAAKKTLRRRKNPSRPSQAPTIWGDSLLKRFILFDYSPLRKELVVGPKYIHGPHKNVFPITRTTIPATLEFGGKERVGYASTIGRVGNYVHLQPNRVVTIAPRPFMGKALEQTKDKIAQMFRNMLGHTNYTARVVPNRRRP